ncbi:PREDICTED: transmembrane protein 217-like [Chrysochloris asiatica]|uniref:Transmembrane protein 217-like n=1 Tax=Chrysochloris asiatica TaxID=185453 RepID=A0A9B0TDS1_CHRAS|nr:PREDICTED: transmembrane protein 217-like [Chrysochloris asiatica]
MNMKKNCFIVGIFSVLNTIQFLLFEVNYVTDFGYKSDMFSVYKETHLDHDSWFIMYMKSIKICLSAITLIVSCTLIYCIYMNIYLGMLIYVIWIIIYEAINFFMVLLIRESIKKVFEELSYLHLIFQVSRMFLHFCCLPFVIKQIIILYKDPKLSNKTGRHRHSSVSIASSWSPIQLALYRKFN